MESIEEQRLEEAIWVAHKISWNLEHTDEVEEIIDVENYDIILKSHQGFSLLIAGIDMVDDLLLMKNRLEKIINLILKYKDKIADIPDMIEKINTLQDEESEFATELIESPDSSQICQRLSRAGIMGYSLKLGHLQSMKQAGIEERVSLIENAVNDLRQTVTDPNDFVVKGLRDLLSYYKNLAAKPDVFTIWEDVKGEAADLETTCSILSRREKP